MKSNVFFIIQKIILLNQRILPIIEYPEFKDIVVNEILIEGEGWRKRNSCITDLSQKYKKGGRNHC